MGARNESRNLYLYLYFKYKISAIGHVLHEYGKKHDYSHEGHSSNGGYDYDNGYDLRHLEH